MRDGHRRFKDDLYAEYARIGNVLASPKRLELLDLLAQRSWSVEELANEAGLSLANASRHLRVLAAARLVGTRRRGVFVDYTIASLDVVRLCRSLAALARERLPDVGAVTARQRREPSASDDDEASARAMKVVTKRSALVLDVRPEAEYRAGHIPGATSIPIAALVKRGATAALPREREIVVYCRGDACVWADEAVALLRKRGFSASRLAIDAPGYALAGGKLDVAG
ncbi:MAG: metalloregulator ArsR/SmtB family transcription factor [Vulcanimicrobiaceae bacterium]